MVLAGIASDKAHMIIATAGSEKTPSRALRFEAKWINPQATPTAKGVSAIKMMEDPIIGGAIMEPSGMEKGFALLVTEKGLMKRITLDDFPVQGRGGQGVQTWKVTPATGKITGFAVTVSAVGDVDIYSTKGRRLRMGIKDLPAGTRAAKGSELKDLIKSSELFGSETVAGVIAN